MLNVASTAVCSPLATLTRRVLTQVSTRERLCSSGFPFCRSLLLSQKRFCSKVPGIARRVIAPRALATGKSRSFDRSLWEPQQNVDRLVAGHSFYVTCHPGLEEVVAAELTSQHIRAQEVVPGKAGVYFRSELCQYTLHCAWPGHTLQHTVLH